MATFDDEQEATRKKEEDKLRRETEKKEQDLKAKAAEALENGDEKKAEKYTEKSKEVVQPSVAPKYEKPKSISFTMHYHGEIVNTEDVGEGKTLNTYEDGTASISGTNEYGQLGDIS